MEVESERAKQAWYMARFMNHFLAMEGTGVLVLDSEFRIVEISDMLCAMFECRRDDVVASDLEDWLAGLPMDPPPFGKAQLSGGAFRDRSWTWKWNGKRFSMMLDGDTMEDNGKQIGAFVIFRDISHQVTLEEQIRQSDRLKTIGQIAAGTAHEIRNPLTAMKGFIQLLGKSLSQRKMEREQEYISIVLSELERVNELVGDFLLLSKPKEIKHELIRAGTVVQEIMPMIRNEALLHNVAVKHYPKTDLKPIIADKDLLKQVFLNLAKNAIEAMPSGGTLTIRECGYPEQPDKLSIELQDTGTGIPAEALEKVFEPFYTTKQQGTGLGLSVCQRIVHDLGGRIEVESGKDGTTFRVWLPYS